MKITDVKYYWVRFYPTAELQVVKFWTEGKKKYIKGLDWALPHILDQFKNKDYQLVYPIEVPE